MGLTTCDLIGWADRCVVQSSVDILLATVSTLCATHCQPKSNPLCRFCGQIDAKIAAVRVPDDFILSHADSIRLILRLLRGFWVGGSCVSFVAPDAMMHRDANTCKFEPLMSQFRAGPCQCPKEEHKDIDSERRNAIAV